MITIRLNKKNDLDRLAQLTLSNEDASAVRQLAGAEFVRIGSPMKGKPFIVLNCITKSGKRFQLFHGDTHSVWLCHQQGLGREWMLMALNALEVGARAVVNVESAFVARLTKNNNEDSDDS